MIARTVKGKGVKAVENQEGWHGKPLDDPEAAIEELGGLRNLTVEVAKPPAGAPHRFETGKLELPRYEVGSEVATRKAYGEALAAVGAARGDVVAIDGEVSNSTFAEIFKAAHPDRFFEMYIAEQQMAAAAVGLQARGYRVFASSFAAFHSRAYDFVRMAAISRATMSLSGSHAGISIGEDGPSQMALEDIASIRAVHGSTVLHPCDGNQTAKLVAAMADLEGISYLRTLRPNTPVVYEPDEEFPIGGSRVLREGGDVTLVGCGITVHEALRAAETLAGEVSSARVIDCYSVKPIDAATLAAAAAETRGIRRRRGSLARGRTRRGPSRGPLRTRCDPEGDPPRRQGDAALGQARRAARRFRDRRSGDRQPGRRARSRSCAVPFPLRHGRRDRNQSAQGARRRAAVRRRLVQGRAA